MRAKSLMGSIFLILTTAPVLLAQGTSASIAGTVMDTTGGVIPGVTVIVTNLDQGTSRSAVSDDEGRYRAPQLVVGTYEVKGELAGFQTSVRSGIELSVGRNAVVDLTMRVGSIAEQVTVTGEASLVETSESSLSGLITVQQVESLPLNGRNMIQLMTLEPGVINYRRASAGNDSILGGYGIDMTVAGARERTNSYLLDGADLVDHRGKLPGSVAGVEMGVESIREFKIQTANFSAEHGRAGGGVITAVTKSGSNQFHGSLYEYHRNDNLDAANFFDNRNEIEKSPFIRNQFGGSIGGPIVKDRTFFFANYEGLRDRTTRVLVDDVPTDEAKLGIFPPGSGGSCPNSFPFDSTIGKCVIDAPGEAPGVVPDTAARYLSLWPSPNSRDFGDGSAEVVIPWASPTDENYFVTKIDHNLNEKHSIFGRWTIDYSDSIQNFVHAAQTMNSSKVNYITLEEKWIASPRLLNLIRYSLVRRNEQDVNDILVNIDPSLYHLPEAGQLGSMRVGSLLRATPHDDRPRVFVHNLFHFTDTVTYTRGRHSMKFGFDHKRYQYNAVSVSRFGGRWVFDDFEDFLLSRPENVTAQLPGSDFGRGLRQSIIAFFAQDDLQLRPNLTVNLGLRYEFITVPDEVNGKLFNMRRLSDTELIPVGGDTGEPWFPNPSLKNFAPRIGISWDPFGDGKTSIRGSYGIFHDQIALYWFQQPAFRMPPSVNVNIEDPPFPDPFADGVPLPSEITVYIFPDDGMNNPYLMKWNMNLQREIVPGIVATVGYIGSRGVKLPRLDQYNICNPEFLPSGNPFFRRRCPRRSSAFNRIESRTSTVNSFYHGFVSKVVRRFNAGLALQGSYTYSRSIDDQANNGNTGIATTWQGSIDFPQANRGLSEFDVRHNFSFNGSWALPGPTGGGLAQAVAGGWQVNGILTLATGSPLSITINRGNSFDKAPSGRFFPDLVPGGDGNPVLDDGRNPDQYFDTSPFILPPLIDDPSIGCGPGLDQCKAYGDLGRSSLINPGIATLDLSFTKKWPIPQLGEHGNFEFRGEFFNLLNRANFGIPEDEVFRSRGRVQGNAGRITNTNTTARQVQFALRINF